MFSTTALYRNSTDSSNTQYNQLAWTTNGNLLKENNVVSGTATPDQPTGINEYDGTLHVKTSNFGEKAFTAINPSSIRYIDQSGSYLTPMVLEPKIRFKGPMEGWPANRVVKLDAEFECATSTKINTAYETDFTVDVGEILADATILLAAVSQTNAWSKRVIMSLAGILKPIASGQTVSFRAKILHSNRPDDGYDSLTYSATFTIKSAIINWYYRPRDYQSLAIENAVQAQRLPSEEVKPKSKKFFKVLRAMFTPSRSIHT